LGHNFGHKLAGFGDRYQPVPPSPIPSRSACLRTGPLTG
jgi:hypothetical protein